MTRKLTRSMQYVPLILAHLAEMSNRSDDYATRAKVGSAVVVMWGGVQQTLRLVAPEVALNGGSGKVAYDSIVGKALTGKKIGDTFYVQGMRTGVILDIF